MPESDVIRRAREDAEKGKALSTQAGEFVREEIEHVREGIHGARNIKQAIAIGLSKARRAGVKLPPPKKGTASAKIRPQAERDSKKGARHKHVRPSRTRSRAILRNSSVKVTVPPRVANFQDRQELLRVGADLRPATSPPLLRSAQKA